MARRLLSCSPILKRSRVYTGSASLLELLRRSTLRKVYDIKLFNNTACFEEFQKTLQLTGKDFELMMSLPEGSLQLQKLFKKYEKH